MIISSMFIIMLVLNQYQVLREIMTKSLSLTSYFMASATRNALTSLTLVILNVFKLVASIEAYRDPTVLLDEEY